jgi:hypothetical protein
MHADLNRTAHNCPAAECGIRILPGSRADSAEACAGVPSRLEVIGAVLVRGARLRSATPQAGARVRPRAAVQAQAQLRYMTAEVQLQRCDDRLMSMAGHELRSPTVSAQSGWYQNCCAARGASGVAACPPQPLLHLGEVCRPRLGLRLRVEVGLRLRPSERPCGCTSIDQKTYKGKFSCKHSYRVLMRQNL